MREFYSMSTEELADRVRDHAASFDCFDAEDKEFLYAVAYRLESLYDEVEATRRALIDTDAELRKFKVQFDAGQHGTIPGETRANNEVT